MWVHPNEHDDYFKSFATMEEAIQYSKEKRGAEAPLVLVRQLEWIDEPKPTTFVHKKGLRITEWRTEWLDKKREPDSIDQFIKEKME